jgi:acetolactate synthase small subunit
MAMPSAVATAAEISLSETSCFSVHARAEPGVMPRVLELFAKRGLVPSLWRSAVSGADQPRLTIEVEMSGLARDRTDYIAACMRQIASVDAVLTWHRDRGA